VLTDAVVLAGGRSSRLGGAPKQALLYSGESLVERTVRAVGSARRTVVVGFALPRSPFPESVVSTRETPPFSGPASAIAAGLRCLDAAAGHDAADIVVVVACDMPNVSQALAVLHAALPLDAGADGLVAIDEGGHEQPLVAVYRASALRAAVRAFEDGDALAGLSVRAFIAAMRLLPVPVPPQSTADVDTSADAAAFGIALTAPLRHPPEE
jgi:molybdopterin-guanine dinucleotide biosynthesis protein A